MTINLGTFTGWTDGAGNELKYRFLSTLKDFLTLPGMAFRPMYLIMRTMFLGGQVQDVRIHS